MRRKENKEDNSLEQFRNLFLTAITFQFTGKGAELSSKFKNYMSQPDLRNKKWKEFKGDVRAFFRMTKGFLSGQYKEISPVILGSIGIAAMYIGLKKDLIPDEDISGWWDDAAVLFWVLNQVKNEVEKFRLWETSEKVNELEIAVV